MGDETIPGKLYTQLDPFKRTHTLAEMSQRLSQVPLVHQPGAQWIYGPGTDVQARLVEVLSGKTFEDFLQERIFRPLEMNETGHYVPPPIATASRHSMNGAKPECSAPAMM